jgi:imidazolonepropionase-like amidohydrolase
MDHNRFRPQWLHRAMLVAILYSAPGYSSASSPLATQQSTTSAPREVATRSEPAVAFEGVTVVDVTDGRLLADQTVVVAGTRVQAVGPVGKVRLPKSTQVIDARDKYLIPGLWDMHAHVEDSVHWYPRFIAHGVTGLREMPKAERGDFQTDSFRTWQREVMAGTRMGPRSVGPSVDLSYIKIATRDDMRRVMDSLKAAGIAFFKVHGAGAGSDPELYFTMLREARRVGLPIVGHTPDRGVTEVEAADSGIRSIEHANEHNQCWSALRKLVDSVEIERQCAPGAKAFARNGTWLTPTTGIFHVLTKTQGAVSQKFVRLMHRFSVTKLLAGSDVHYKFIGRGHRPGLSLQQELAFFVESGLTPLEALQTATLNPAKYLEATDSIGTVAIGKLADLVLLDANPLADIRNVGMIRAVVANGRYFDRTALDAMDPEGLTAASAWRQKAKALAEPPPAAP